jgi:hypothetical protein
MVFNTGPLKISINSSYAFDPVSIFFAIPRQLRMAAITMMNYPMLNRLPAGKPCGCKFNGPLKNITIGKRAQKADENYLKPGVGRTYIDDNLFPLFSVRKKYFNPTLFLFYNKLSILYIGSR